MSILYSYLLETPLALGITAISSETLRLVGNRLAEQAHTEQDREYASLFQTARYIALLSTVLASSQLELSELFTSLPIVGVASVMISDNIYTAIFEKTPIQRTTAAIWGAVNSALFTAATTSSGSLGLFSSITLCTNLLRHHRRTLFANEAQQALLNNGPKKEVSPHYGKR